MRVFCMDMHISVVEDFKSANPHIEVVDWCMSGHYAIMNKQLAVPKYINHGTWKDLNPRMIAMFQANYDRFLRSFDAFLVCFTTAFALVFEKYDKPIIMINACRYDLPFCWNRDMKMAQELNQCLQRLQSSNRLKAVSNNRTDQLYTLYGAGIRTTLIPSLCLYTNMKYSPTKPTFLVYSGSFEHPLVTPKPSGYYQWLDIASYRGVIHFPYEAGMTMSMFEHFTAGIPMFIPSKTYWKANPNIQSASAYWGSRPPLSLEPFKSEEFWIENSCLWETLASPNTIVFDSLEDLAHKLETFEYTPEGDFRERRIADVRQKWARVLSA